jgi:hypothetical protein
MSEQLKLGPKNPYDDNVQRSLFERRKSADDAVHNLSRITVKNALGMAMGGKYRKDLMTAENNAIDARNAGRRDLSQNYDQRVQEAIYDFQRDPKVVAEGQTLNLPNDGLPKAATNVRIEQPPKY